MNFNSHAHVERDSFGGRWFGSYAHFNSHAHVERDRQRRNADYLHRNFNSHAHVERDIFDNTAVTAEIISTHTLTWSVTIFVMPPTKGEIDFNSHAHVERDS